MNYSKFNNSGCFKTRSVRCLIFLLSLIAGHAFAHPVAQGSMDIVVHPDRIEIQARVSVEQAFVEEGFSEDAPAENTAAIWPRHGNYILKHLFVDVDGTKLEGSIVKITPPPTPIPTDHIGYEITYAFPQGLKPKRVTVSQDLLNEFDFAIGNPWEATFVTKISEADGGALSGLLFTRNAPVVFDVGSDGETEINRGRLFWDYAQYGIMHILKGYDHLLFMAVLMLAVTSLLDLVKVVTAFTLAHTVTLTLSVLNIVRLPSSIVEPVIAASIVIVAAQNIFFPSHSRGWTRLLVAFGFGLFHGLGFAGGLLDAMEGLPGLAVATAIVAFSIGVEIGHQAVVIPMFLGMKMLAGDHDSKRRLAIQRYVSAAVSLAGIYYFIAAVG
jgi:hypothetical protein